MLFIGIELQVVTGGSERGKCSKTAQDKAVGSYWLERVSNARSVSVRLGNVSRAGKEFKQVAIEEPSKPRWSSWALFGSSSTNPVTD